MLNVTSGSIPWLAKGSPGYNLFADPPVPPAIPKYILAGIESDEAAPQRRIASRGTEVFVAAGCEIRCVDLRDLKARYEEEQEGDKGTETTAQGGINSEREYQVLDIQQLDFTIHQLEVSPDGNYLAILGEKRVAVCMLPAPGFARLNMAKLRAKYHEVGTSYHNDNSERVVRGIWHPFGVDGASLTVLTSDAVVRLYDFTMHLESTFEVPDQIFDLNALSGRERHRTSFMPDPESFEPASCCFASGDLSWRPFTLYILMRGGDIYALCPIVPSRWLPSENYLYSLERELSFQLESLGTSTDVTRDDRLALRDQTRWLEEVMNQEAAKRALNGRKKQDWFTRPESIGPTPKLQGPFLLQPAPVDVSADEVYACDILHITAEPFATICAVWSNTNIDVFLEFEPIQARWVGKKLRQKQLEEDKNPPIIGAFETVTIGAPLPQNHARKHWPLFVENPLISEVVFVAHHAGIEAVDLSEWLKGLKQVVDPDEGEEFIAKQIARTTGSTKKKIVNSGGTLPHLPHSIDGCVVLQDSYVGYILIASSCRMVYPTDFDIPFELRNVGGIGDTLSSVKPTRVSQQLPGYIPSIAQPLYDPSAILRAPTSLQHFIQANLSRNPNLMKGRLNYNAETLEILRQGREQVKREYETVTTVAEALYTRAKQQRIEYERQLLKIHELITRQESFEAGNVKGRLDRALKEQQALVGRADALMRLLVRKGLGGSGEATGVVKSEREREWELELEKLVKKTGFVEGKGKEKDEDYTEKSGLEKRVEQVRDILEEMKPLVEKGSGENEGAGGAQDRGDGVPEELRKKKVGELNEMLDKESFLINATKAKLERLETKCEEMRL